MTQEQKLKNLLPPAGRQDAVLRGSEKFNMKQDIAAARVVFGSGVPLVHLQSVGVVSDFAMSKLDIVCWFCGKNPLSDYLGGERKASHQIHLQRQGKQAYERSYRKTYKITEDKI